MKFDYVNDNKLFLVVLGGRTKLSNIEIHDLRWVVGRNIEDTFPQLRNEWFGDQKGLHMDSFIEIKFIDGYRILLQKETLNRNIISKSTLPSLKKKNLWFVNVGGYDPNQLNELHEFGLVVAESSVEAKRKARQKFLIGSKYKHIDDIARLNKFELVDDCHSIINIHGWKVELTLDPKKRSQKLIPDWYGFRRIVN